MTASPIPQRAFSIAPTSIDLPRQVPAGDSAAWELFVREHATRMLIVARRMVRNEEDAADAVQDAFISAYKSMNSFESRAQLSTWMHRIVVNACLMQLRKCKRRGLGKLLPVFDETGHHANPVAEWGRNPSEEAERSDVRSQVRACIDRLPEPYRTVLMLRDIEQFDTETTAELTACSIECVKSRLHRARTALRTLLEPIFVGQPV